MVIEFDDARIWDTSAVAALYAVVAKFHAHHIDATFTGLKALSAKADPRLQPDSRAGSSAPPGGRYA